MILRGGLFLFCLFKGVLDLLGLIWAWQFFPWVLFYSCFLPLSLSLVPSLLAYFPSAFGKPSDEKEENKHQGSCNHTGLSSFSAEQAEPSFQQQRRGTVASPVLCPAQVLYVAEDGGLTWAGTARGWGKRSVAVQKMAWDILPSQWWRCSPPQGAASEVIEMTGIAVSWNCVIDCWGQSLSL